MEKPSNDINSHSFLMNKKGLNKSYSNVLQAQISICSVIINGLGGRPVSLLPKLYSDCINAATTAGFVKILAVVLPKIMLPLDIFFQLIAKLSIASLRLRTFKALKPRSDVF